MIASKNMTIEAKEDYLDEQLRRKANRAALPSPKSINNNLKVVDHMRQQGHLPMPGVIYQKGVENSKNYTSGNSQFMYSPNVITQTTNERLGTTKAQMDVHLPPTLVNKKVGRFSSSPNHFKSELN